MRGRANFAALQEAGAVPAKRRRVLPPEPEPAPAPAGPPLVALDCEMVGCGPLSMLCRVVVLDSAGETLYSSWVAPAARVTDYRTEHSGATAELLRDAPPASVVRERVAALLEGRVLVGHDVRHDLAALELRHPPARTRDTARYPPLLNARGRPQALRHLARTHLQRRIQRAGAAHDPREDALAALDLYKKHSAAWEQHVRAQKKQQRKQQ